MSQRELEIEEYGIKEWLYGVLNPVLSSNFPEFIDADIEERAETYSNTFKSLLNVHELRDLQVNRVKKRIVDVLFLQGLGIDEVDAQQISNAARIILNEPQTGLSMKLDEEMIPIQRIFDRIEGIRKVPPNEITLLKVIGAGSFGTVFEALWNQSRVVVKVFTHTQYNQDREKHSFEAAHKNMEKEIRFLIKATPHPSILQPFAYCIEELDQRVYLVLEHIEFGCFIQFVNEYESVKDKILIKELLHMMADVASAVGHLHSIGILHCDIAARNVMVTAGLRGKLADFGSCKTFHSCYSRGICTPMERTAPESVISSEVQTDIFMLGLTLWEMLMKETIAARTFTDETIFSALCRGWRPLLATRKKVRCESKNTSFIASRIQQKHTSKQMECADIPIEVKNIIQDCWSIDPNDRPMAFYVANTLRCAAESVNY